MSALRTGGRVFRVLRKVPFIDEAVDRFQRTYLNPVVTRMVRSTDHPDLDAALELYKKRIPDDQQFDPSDIIRWLREDAENRRANGAGPFDWFVVAKVRRRVYGFILFHYYPAARLAFFAYMVVANTPGVQFNLVSRELVSYASRLLAKRKELRGYQGFVLEVEDPRKAKSKKKQDECLARVRRFCALAEMQGFSLRAFDFDYKQPKLSLSEAAATERSLLLLSARLRATGTAEIKPRAEVEEILTFIYMMVYPEGYSADPAENHAYKEYCESLLKQQLSQLPQNVRSLNPTQLPGNIGKIGRTKSATESV